MKILVTGANGYLGTGVVSKLCEKNVEVIAVTRNENNSIDKRANIIVSDIFDVKDPFNRYNKPDILLHMAWNNGFVHNDISHINELHLHYNFIRNIAEQGLSKITVIGSMHEIGFFEGSINENTPTHPESLYGISKNALRNAIELLCKQYNIVFQWLRGFYIVGNSIRGCSVFSKIVQAEKTGNKLFPFTTGLNQWDFLDYNEFCNQVVATVLQDKINGIINICNGRPEKLSERVEKFIKDNNFNIKLDYGKFPDRPYDSKAVWGDNSKITKIMDEYISNEIDKSFF